MSHGKAPRAVAMAHDWRTPAHCISANEDICCFRARLLGTGKLSVFKRRSLAPAITPGASVFDAFLGLWSREKATLAHRSDAKNQWNRWSKAIATPKSLRTWPTGYEKEAPKLALLSRGA